MATQRIRAQRLWLCLLALGLFSGCGGGDQDFGPTRKIGLPSGNKESVAAANPAAPTKHPESAKNSADPDAKTDVPESTPPTNSDLKTVVAKAAPEAKASPRRSREDDDSPTPVAKSSGGPVSSTKTDPPTKDNQENLDKSKHPQAAETDAESPTVDRKPLSPELREWLIAKRRQAGSSDGLAMLTAADLGKVSWHDLRTGQFSHEFFGKSGTTTGLLLSPDRRWVVGATNAGWLRLWTIESVAGLDQFARETRRAAQAALSGIETEQEGVWALAADRQGKWFLAGGADTSYR